YHRRRGHFGEVPFVESGHTVEKTGTHSIMRIGINPGEGHNTTLNDLPEHLQAKLWLRLKDQVLWNPAFFALGGVLFVKPRFGHIKPTVQKRVAQTRRVGEKNSLLTVGKLAQGAAVLPLHTDRMFAFLWETATIKDDRPVRLAEVSCDQPL